MSFSLERLVMIDRETHDQSFSSILDVSSITTRRQTKKRVSFRLPEETDVIIFYSPKDSIMVCDQDCFT